MKNRSELREIIMKVLYQANLYDEAKISYELNDLIKEQLEIENEFVETSVNGIIKNKKSIEKTANKYLKDGTIDRLSKVDQKSIVMKLLLR